MKEDIIKKASEMFLKYGLRSVSVDDICSEMRISKKTFYNVFKTKEMLLEELLEKAVAESGRLKIEVKEGMNVVDLMRDSTSKFITRQALVEKHVAFLYDLEKYYPDLHKRFSERIDEVKYKQTEELIRLGQKEGLFREDIKMEMAVRVVKEVIKVALSKIPGMTMAERSEEALGYLLRILTKD